MTSVQKLISSIDPKLLLAVSIVVVLYVLRLFLYRIINKNVENIKSRYQWRQAVNYIIIFLALLFTVRIWFEWVQSLFTLLTLIVAALTIVSKELLLNVFAYGVIVWRELFSLGDRIEISVFKGDVIQKGIMYFSLAEVGGAHMHPDERTGRIVKVPNALVLTQSIANFSKTQSVIWSEFSIPLTIDSNSAKLIMFAETVVAKNSYVFTEQEWSSLRGSEEEIVFLRKEPEVYIEVHNGKMVCTLRYLAKFYNRRAVHNSIAREILQFIAQQDDISLEK
jgi:small-conductance mechanosensitive channel